MAAKPSVKRILSENLPSGSTFSWLPPVVATINQFFDQVSRALDKRLTISDNIDGDIRTVDLDGVYPVKLSWARSKPVAILVGACTQLTGTTTDPTAAVGIDWEWRQDSTIGVTAVHGITPASDKKYRLTLVILCG